MLFNTLEYPLFLFLVAVIFFLMPPAYRWVLLLLASYYFYACWGIEYLVPLVLITVVCYAAGLGLSHLHRASARMILLVVCVTFNLGLLFTFKYWNFFADSLRAVSHIFAADVRLPAWQVLLPIGISFYTFQAIGYVVDVYRRRIPAQTHPGLFATFLAFFPQLLAGPIGRGESLLPQFHRAVSFDPARLRGGLQLLLWGAFKKIAIADRVRVVVNTVYDDPQAFGGAALILATFFFAIQIYCDFSGYTDMAIGSARILGFDLMTNFRVPYLARTFKDFWRRWHISLSTWFRDYLYIPLGGNRTGTGRWVANILVVFLLSGLWHGASWTFAVWGLLHGFYLVVEELVTRAARSWAGRPRRVWARKLLEACRLCVVFGAVTIAWVFFRAASLGDAWTVLQGMVSSNFRLREVGTLGLAPLELLFAFYGIAVLVIVDTAGAQWPRVVAFYQNHTALRQACHVALIYSMVFFGVFGRLEFIYFQF